MTKLIERPTTDVESRLLGDAKQLEKPPVRRRPLPPIKEPRRYSRWLGWIIVFAAVAVTGAILLIDAASNDVVGDRDARSVPSSEPELVAEAPLPTQGSPQTVEQPSLTPAPGVVTVEPVYAPPAIAQVLEGYVPSTLTGSSNPFPAAAPIVSGFTLADYLPTVMTGSSWPSFVTQPGVVELGEVYVGALNGSSDPFAAAAPIVSGFTLADYLPATATADYVPSTVSGSTYPLS